MKGNKVFKLLVTIIFILFPLTACVGEGDVSAQRQAWVSDKSNQILIGIPGPGDLMKNGTGFIDGVNLAVKEVNAQGGIGGRELGVIVKDDEGSFMTGTTIAQSFVNNPKVVAVVGHWHSHITIPASTIYEKSGLVMLSPVVSNTNLTQRGYQFVFQNIPTDDEIGKQMALFAKQQGYRHIAIYYADTSYGRGLANSFEDVARRNNISIVGRASEFKDDNDFMRTIEKWKALDYEAVFVADSLPAATDFITKLKKINPDIPIMGGDGLDFDFIETLGAAAEGAVLATSYNPDSERPELEQFKQKFMEEYGQKPDVWAIQGYDSIKLLADAMNNTETPTPENIAQQLRALKDWPGIIDDISFNENGAVEGKTVYKKMVRNGEFVYLEK
ncbi:MAG: branched-chain amino acid ABC transporter substrate-binding protein [Firmicutes bacterium]|nr:branched-chain amino acid ABC transporter substrate-binding protein [Bacillota bacterium]